MGRHAQHKNYKVKCHLWLVAFAFCAVSCGGGRSTKPTVITTTNRQTISLLDTLRADTIHFGRVRAGEVVVREFLLSNPSAAPLLIVGTETSCGCLEMEYSHEPITAGAISVAKMTFYSSGYNYFPPRAFYIITSASHTPKKLVVIADME